MLFQAREVSKTYEAICLAPTPLPQPKWLIDLPLALDWPNRPKHQVDYEIGKPSQTAVERLSQLDGYAHLRLRPITGRSHQLRVHLAHTNLPILGDCLYARPQPGAMRLNLHACLLAFRHPFTGKYLSFVSRPPFLNSLGFKA